MNALTTFVSARLDELRQVDEGRAPTASDVAGWRELVEDYEAALPLTERWVRLETAVRQLAGRFSVHPDFDPRWSVPAQAQGRGRASVDLRPQQPRGVDPVPAG